MMFKSDRQRKAIFSQLACKNIAGRFNKFSFGIGKDDTESLEKEYSKIVDSSKEEYKRIMEKSHKEAMRSMFSEKRGSVPLLPNTYVIRGSFPKQRQKVKRALDMIGDEAPMKNINTIMINADQDVPLVFHDENSVGLSEKFLHGSDGEIAKLILASVYRKSHPEAAEGAEYAYSTDVVEPKVREQIRRDSEKRQLDDLEIHQVGVVEQPQYEVIRSEPSDNVEVKIVMPEEEKPAEVKMMGVGENPEQYIETVKEKSANPNLYYNPQQ